MNRTPRLLVVDDDEQNRELLARRLRAAAFDVDTADGGVSALRAIEAGTYDLLLLDIQMPVMSGVEVLRTLRTTHPSTRLAIIMATGRTDSRDVVEALEQGADDFVSKPIDMAVLLARIRTQVARLTTERRLQDREEQYALAVEGANDGLWDWKLAEDVVYFSPRWKGVLGYEDHEVENRIAAWFDRIHPADADRVHHELDEHLRGATAHFASEHRLRHKHGDYRWVHCRAAAVRDKHGAPLRVAGSLTDITGGKIADPLTGLPNRMLFLDRLTQVIERTRARKGSSYAVLFLDLDRFKLINDSMGHRAGDELLITAGRRLERCLRHTDRSPRQRDGVPAAPVHDTVARLGGDEFAVALGQLHTRPDVMRIASRISEAFAEPFAIDGREVFVSVSIGIALSSPDYQTAEQVLHDADTAMYYAKMNGRGRIEVFSTAMRVRAVARLEMENELRLAVERGELTVYYQPIINLADGVASSFEALVRWNHPERGLLGPESFIGLAEETGLITPIGEWVLRQACRQLVAWDLAQAGIRAVVMAVNLSARQLADPTLVDRVSAALRETGVTPGRIELELTESSVMADPDMALDTLRRLKSLGVRLSIDDFGTGYSSLAHLQRFPVDRLKIDRLFLEHASQSPKQTQVLKTIVGLARDLGLEVIAEGVETQIQAEYLRELSCDMGQGFYFSRPVTPLLAEPLFDRLAKGQFRQTAIETPDGASLEVGGPRPQS